MVLEADAWCVSRSLAQGDAARPLPGPPRHRVRAGHPRLRRDAAPGPGRHLDHRGDARRLRRAAPAGLRALGRGVAGRRAGRRPVRRVAGRRLLRRVDVRRAPATRRRWRSSPWSSSWRRWDIPLIDCQVHTEHMARFGAEEWPRAALPAARWPPRWRCRPGAARGASTAPGASARPAARAEKNDGPARGPVHHVIGLDYVRGASISTHRCGTS